MDILEVLSPGEVAWGRGQLLQVYAVAVAIRMLP